MMLFKKKTGITELSHKCLEEASHVLARAFENDPMVNYVLGKHTPEQRRAYFAYMCELHCDLEWPVLGYLDHSKLAGLVCVNTPDVKEWPASIVSNYTRLGGQIGQDAIRRLEAYTQLSNRLRPKEPHYYIGVIGVDPDYRGKGYGKLLLDAVQEISRKNPASVGVALDTESTDSLNFYEHNGYHTIAQDKLESNQVWLLLRPN